MSFFNENDFRTVRQTIDNKNAKKEQEALNRKFHAQIFANNMMKTFLLYKEAAKEFPDICRSVGIEPFSAKEESFFGKTYYIYKLFCASIRENPNVYGGSSLFNVGVTQNGVLVEFKDTGHEYKTKSGYEPYYIVRNFPEHDLKRKFEDFFFQFQTGKISFCERTNIGLLGELLLFSFPGSRWEQHHDMYSEVCVECDTLNPKSKEEVRESIKKHFLQMAT